MQLGKLGVWYFTDRMPAAQAAETEYEAVAGLLGERLLGCHGDAGFAVVDRCDAGCEHQ